MPEREFGKSIPLNPGVMSPFLGNLKSVGTSLRRPSPATAHAHPARAPREPQAGGFASSPPHTPFLPDTHHTQGDIITCFENNMFRAPAYQHAMRPTDFIVIHTTEGRLFVRQVKTIFMVGQLMPKETVPKPKSKREMEFKRNRLKTLIFRILQRKGFVRIEEVQSLMSQSLAHSYVRKVLSEFATHCAVSICISAALLKMEPPPPLTKSVVVDTLSSCPDPSRLTGIHESGITSPV